MASFDGGTITAHAGAPLSGQADRTLLASEKFATCFADARTAGLFEHQVTTTVMHRAVGVVLGYEDLNDHDELRRDPVTAVSAGKLEPQRPDYAPLAVKSTLNQLGQSRAEPSRYHEVSHDPAAIESRPLIFSSTPTRRRRSRSSSNSMPPTIRCTATRKASTSTVVTTAMCPLYIFWGRHLLSAKLRRSNVDGAAGAIEEVARVAA